MKLFYPVLEKNQKHISWLSNVNAPPLITWRLQFGLKKPNLPPSWFSTAYSSKRKCILQIVHSLAYHYINIHTPANLKSLVEYILWNLCNMILHRFFPLIDISDIQPRTSRWNIFCETCVTCSYIAAFHSTTRMSSPAPWPGRKQP